MVLDGSSGDIQDLEGADSLCVLRKPDGGEVPPTEFPDDDVSAVGEGVADVHWVVAALAVVFPIFLVLSRHVGRRKALVERLVRHGVNVNVYNDML